MKYFYLFDDGEDSFVVETGYFVAPYQETFRGEVVQQRLGTVYSIGHASDGWLTEDFHLVYRNGPNGKFELPVCLIDDEFVYPGETVFVNRERCEIFHSPEYETAIVVFEDDYNEKPVLISDISRKSRVNGWVNLYAKHKKDSGEFVVKSRGPIFESRKEALENAEEGCYMQHYVDCSIDGNSYSR